QRNCIQCLVHRALSFDVLLAQYTLGRRGFRALFYRNAMLRMEAGGSLASTRLEDSGRRSTKTGAARRSLLRTITLLSRIRSRLLLTRTSAGGPKQHSHSWQFRCRAESDVRHDSVSLSGWSARGLWG